MTTSTILVVTSKKDGHGGHYAERAWGEHYLDVSIYMHTSILAVVDKFKVVYNIGVGNI